MKTPTWGNPQATRIQLDLSMEDVLRKYFPGMKTYGGRCPCPLHHGTHNNFSFHGNLWKCYVCGEGGNTLQFAERFFGVGRAEAVRRLAEDFSVGGGGLTAEEQARIDVSRKTRTLLDTLLNQKADYEDQYHQCEMDIERYKPKGMYDAIPDEYGQAIMRLEMLKQKINETEDEIWKQKTG